MNRPPLAALAVLLLSLASCSAPKTPPVEPLDTAAAASTDAPIHTDAPDISGAWWDTQTRCVIEVESTQSGICSIVISWSSSVSERTEWHLLAAYDPAAALFRYSGGIKQRVTHDAVGNVSTEELYQNGSGTIEYKDGFLYWTDDLEATRDGSPFTNQIN